MTVKTRAKPAEPAAPPTFADIARKKMRDRLQAYRQFVKRQAEGEQLEEADLATVADCLEALQLPDYAWALHVEALQRHAAVSAKLRAVVDAEPEKRQRSLELAKEVEVLQAKLRTLQEELRRTHAAAGKSAAYGQSLAQLAVEHAVVLADLDDAVTLRLEELNRRKQGSMS